MQLTTESRGPHQPSSDAAEFGIVMVVVERPDQVEWALQRLRAVYPAVPFTLISDGQHQPRYERIAEVYGGSYQRGEKLKRPEHGAKWWQRTFEAGLALETPYVLKIDPDTSFNRPITSWPAFDCFGTVIWPDTDREHVQGGVQGFRRSAVERIVASGICLRPEFREVESWAWDASQIAEWKRDGYLSTDQTLRRILLALEISWGPWPDVISWYLHTPPDAARHAISHAHKWMQLHERRT